MNFQSDFPVPGSVLVCLNPFSVQSVEVVTVGLGGSALPLSDIAVISQNPSLALTL